MEGQAMHDLNDSAPHRPAHAAPAHAAPPVPDSGTATPEAMPRKRHRIYDNRILALFANVILFLAVSNMLSLVVVVAIIALDAIGIISLANPIGEATAEQTGLITSTCSILTGIWLQLFMYERRVKGEQESVVKWSKQGMLLVLPALAFAIINLIGVTAEKLATMNPIPYCLVMALAPGISEEVMFRGTTGSNWMRVRGEARDILPGCLVTSLAFGLTHATNALSGAPLGATAFQVYYAFCLGMIFDAVLLRSGSIVPAMIMHTLIDFTGFLFMDMSRGGIITEELTIDFSFFATLFAAAALCAWALYLLRPSKHEEIVALWNKKCYRD